MVQLNEHGYSPETERKKTQDETKRQKYSNWKELTAMCCIYTHNASNHLYENSP